MEFSTLELTLEAGIAIVALNRPDKANAMSEPMWYEIGRAMEWLDAANLVGPASYVKERLAAFAEAGVTNLSVLPASAVATDTANPCEDSP